MDENNLVGNSDSSSNNDENDTIQLDFLSSFENIQLVDLPEEVSSNSENTDIDKEKVSPDDVKEIISNFNSMHSEKDNLLEEEMKLSENLKEDNKHNNNNYFDKLPSSTVYNICDFLDRNDMNNLKMCSMSLSLTIFDIMKCIKIGIVNMNEIILNNEYKYSPKLKILSKIKIKRLKPFTKYKSLMYLYQNKYNIPFENMIVLEILVNANRFFNTNDNHRRTTHIRTIVFDLSAMKDRQIHTISVSCLLRFASL